MIDQSELFDTRGVTDSAEHWDAVAARVALEAAGRSRAAGVSSLAASRAGLIAALLLLAASLAFMAMASRQGSARPAAELRQALAPGDDVGRAIALTGRPPTVGALLFDDQRRSGGQP
jgi:hypothetical protein